MLEYLVLSEPALGTTLQLDIIVVSISVSLDPCEWRTVAN